MAKLTMAKAAANNGRPTMERKLTPTEILQIQESRKENMGYSQEWPRQKLRIADLKPDEEFIKESSEHEYKYFILLMIPLVVTAAFVLVNKNGLYEDFLVFLESILSDI